ncbi:heavy metal-associated isoprenylated plant 21-like [Olea europaea subsp. europaea]|uniref:Heavy metal-associated isoprenylated plant 21-like n=1 Tax=Olea europaea subsp. europaea TaxID=158383 RepID=A0A8S0Q305_OLEEU|nr:heavy metal-associated isoprenylated plant 21-like [Olea europaea subsp. europaea]
MGALRYLANLCTVESIRSKRRRSMQTVEIKVKMDCDGCERRVKNAVKYMEGVKTVEINRKQSRLTVNGYVDPNKVLRKVKNTGKRAEFWPYIPHNVVHYSYTSQAYDKKAPPGFVKNLTQALPSTNATEERIMFLFSEDNPNACSIM